jgi:hypothetical protein
MFFETPCQKICCQRACTPSAHHGGVDVAEDANRHRLVNGSSTHLDGVTRPVCSTTGKSGINVQAHGPFFFVGKRTGLDLHTAALGWAEIATSFLWFHHAGDERDQSYDTDFFEGLTATGLLDYSECDKIFSCASHPEPQHQRRCLSNVSWWEYGTQEHETIPNLWRMTPLLNFGFFPDDGPASNEEVIRIHAVYRDYLDDQSTIVPLEATHGSPALFRSLELPNLPDTVFCYHLQDEWASREVEKIISRLPGSRRFLPVVVPPMLKAAILENVDIL